jgi:hypothetical protein
MDVEDDMSGMWRTEALVAFGHQRGCDPWQGRFSSAVANETTRTKWL